MLGHEPTRMKYNYVKSRISDAVFELCTGPGDVKARLLSATKETISLTSRSFPDELWPLWVEIHSMLTKHGPRTDIEGAMLGGAIDNTLQKIQKRTGTKIAIKIYELHRALQSNY